jgi:hypothetical protein
MRDDTAEHRHDAITGELRDHAACALDTPTQESLVGSQEPLDILDIEMLGTAREADQVGEQHRHDPPLTAVLSLHDGKR